MLNDPLKWLFHRDQPNEKEDEVWLRIECTWKVEILLLLPVVAVDAFTKKHALGLRGEKGTINTWNTDRQFGFAPWFSNVFCWGVGKDVEGYDVGGFFCVCVLLLAQLM